MSILGGSFWDTQPVITTTTNRSEAIQNRAISLLHLSNLTKKIPKSKSMLGTVSSQVNPLVRIFLLSY